MWYRHGPRVAGRFTDLQRETETVLRMSLFAGAQGLGAGLGLWTPIPDTARSVASCGLCFPGGKTSLLNL